MDSIFNTCFKKDTSMIAVLWKKGSLKLGREEWSKTIFAVTIHGDLETVNKAIEYLTKEYTGIFKTNKVVEIKQ